MVIHDTQNVLHRTPLLVHNPGYLLELGGITKGKWYGTVLKYHSITKYHDIAIIIKFNSSVHQVTLTSQ